jgi:hypothetical protein
MNANRSPEPKTVLTPTEARQGSRRVMNLRVLVVSLVLLGVLGLALTAAFDRNRDRGAAAIGSSDGHGGCSCRASRTAG